MLQLLQFAYGVLLLPPGIFIVALVIYCIWIYRNQRRLPKGLVILTALLYLLSTSWVGNLFIRPLESRYVPPQQLQGDVIVMLGGGAYPDTPAVQGEGQLTGSAANRLLTAAQLYHKLKVPVLVSGGQVYRTSGQEAEIAKAILMGLGVPENKIIVENQSLNTTENAKYSKRLMDEYSFHAPILVTSAFHMERAIRQFDKVGVKVTPFPADYQANRSTGFEISQLRPSASALENVSIAIKEYAGIMISRWY